MGVLGEPLTSRQARRVLNKILRIGGVEIPPFEHAEERMDEREIEEIDVINTLRLGKVSCAKQEADGTWIYRVDTSEFGIGILFESDERAVVCSAWLN